MSRLLHAAARGARLQCSLVGIWEDTKVRPTAESNMTRWRIHPEDVHLQYGPISSALREEAKCFSGRSWHIGTELSVELRYGAWHDCRYSDWLTRSMFLLILSEALADEGL